MWRTFPVNPERPDLSLLRRAAEALRAGEVIAYPTDTLYGLGVNAADPAALARLFALKGRPPEKPPPLLIGEEDQLGLLAAEVPPRARRLLGRLWPGPLTLIVHGRADLAPSVLGPGAGVGVRLPRHALCQALCREARFPITATSANRSGEPPLREAAAIEEAFGERLALILDAGPLPPPGAEGAEANPSTVVDVRGERPELIREGAVAWEEVLRAAEP
ncbi:MAG: L-threonylcarbamoyladenylate synthase [Nitrospinota bacterium]